MMQPQAAPVLTFPSPVADWVRDAYDGAKVILEYGSGGSTVVAADMTDKTIFSVESDPEWLADMRRFFADHDVASPVRFHYGDIGPTKKWGFPVNNAARARFHLYALGIWDEPDFVQPDVVLIDGRFRVGCFLATLFRTAGPVSVYIDDYADRPQYQIIEEFVPVAETRDRMARFEVTPRSVPAARLSEIITLFGIAA